MHGKFAAKMRRVTKSHIGDHGSEQILLDEMIQDGATLKVGWLDSGTFVAGGWYNDAGYRKAASNPAVILNNWIVGNEAKKQRAIKWDHWFLNGAGTCAPVSASTPAGLNVAGIKSSATARSGAANSAMILPPSAGLRRTGSKYGGWTYNATGITADSVVYSVGIGEDTSWDEAMMSDHGLHVWGFDPTPKAAQYVRNNQALGSDFHFTAEGLAVKPATLAFTKPKNPNRVSMRQGTHSGRGGAIEVPVNTLSSAGWKPTATPVSMF
jgi:hypothetical protein